MKQQGLPKHITILGHKIKIKQEPMNADHGEFQHSRSQPIIKIDSGHETDGMRGRILFHECMHAALGLSGLAETLDHKQEEAIVFCLEHSLWHLIEKGVFSGIDRPEE